jgi:hypothetical protein
MEQEKGLKKDNIKKLFKWEGKKEIIWILFILFVFFIAWAYSKETKSCKEMQATDCYKKCSFEDAVEKVRLANPELQFTCSYETLNCEFSGTNIPDLMGGFNITFKGNESAGDTNNSFKDTR